jgi:hypothetical protein
MRRFLIATLLAVPVLAAATQDASAFFSTCGEFHKKWSFSCPRIIFGIDSGCAAPHTPLSYGNPYALQQQIGCAMPWYAGYPVPQPGLQPGPCAARPMMPPAQPQMATQPVSYQYYAQPQANYGYYYNTPSQGVPAYWYFNR